jgi:hypothetical protein
VRESPNTGELNSLQGTELQFYDPATGRRLLTPIERLAGADAARLRVEAENERLRRELEALRRGRLPES